jgi:hypothetical protein
MRKARTRSKASTAQASAADAQAILEKEVRDLKEQAAASPDAAYTPKTVNRAMTVIAWHESQIREWESFVSVA